MEAEIKMEIDVHVKEEILDQKDSEEINAGVSEIQSENLEMSQVAPPTKNATASVKSSPTRSSIESDTKTNKESTNGSIGPHKRRHIDTEVTSDDDEDFVGFDKSELENNDQYILQNIKKLREMSDDEMSPQKKSGQQQKIDVTDPAFRVPFTYGWKRELVLRADPNNSKEKGEVYYLTPNGKKLRTRQEIQNHLHDDLTISNFTLVKVAIGASPEDELIRPAKFYNFSRRSGSELTPEPTLMGKRTIKVKLPKGASPPSSPLHTPPATKSNINKAPTSRPTASTPKAVPVTGFARNAAKENQDSFASPILPVGKAQAKKIKSDRCTIQCIRAMGKIPQLQCKLCLCLYHHECVPKATVDAAGMCICENCKIQIAEQGETSQPSALPTPSSVSRTAPGSKKQQQPPKILSTINQNPGKHNFDKQPQTIVTINGKRFIIFESANEACASDGDKRKPVRSLAPLGPIESTSKAGNSKNQRNAQASSTVSTTSTSSFNLSENLFCTVSAGYGILLQTFQYLKVQELQRASCVCRMWNQVAHHKTLWRTVRMKNSHVNDWQGFVNTLKRNGTKHLDLRKMFVTNQDESWKEFLDNIGVISKLEQIDLCRCHSSVVENLFRTNPNLRVINAVSLKDDKVDLCGLSDIYALEELRLRTTSSNGLQLLKVSDIFDLQSFQNLRHLSLTTFQNLDALLNNNDNWGNLVQLQSLELGYCENVSDQQLTTNLGGMINLQRLRIEKGIGSFNVDVILSTISSELHNLVQLELINCDVKPGFDESIRKCRNVKKLLLIPTYVSQSAATNFMILNGVTQLRGLDTFVWVVTNELLRVTELYIDQCDNKVEKNRKADKNNSMSSPVKVSDSIPILKPVPGLDTNDNVDEQQQQTQTADTPQQVDIVQLKVVDTILNKKLPNTKVKLLKLAHLLTWRQTLDLQ